MTFKRRSWENIAKPANTAMPASTAKPVNTALPENTAMPTFLTCCETEMHIWKYGCE